MNPLKQFVSSVLCIGMFLSCATAKVVAIDAALPTEATVKGQETLVGEITDKREVNIKTFLTSDFRFQAYIYPYAVHYKANGKYETINNRLIESASDSTVLENTANRFKVRFAKNTNASKLVSFTSGSIGFSWEFEGLNKTFITIDNNESGKTNEITDISNTHSMVLYSDAFLNTDLQYVLDGDELKENFILKAKGAPTSFTQTINIQQGSVVEENGMIVFKDKDGVTQYVMGGLSMTDASGAFSTAVRLSYEKTIQGINLTITADQAWINDPAREYPITIDPSIQTSLDRSLIDDAHVSSGLPTQQNGNAFILKTGYGSSSKINYSFIKFTLPTLTSSDMVISAVLEMRTLTGVDNDTVQVNVHEVTSGWNESTITWNNKPSYNSIIEDYAIVPENAWVSWDITRITKLWYTNKTNYGLMIRNNSDSSYYTEYYSADTGTPYTTSRPNVVITYVNTNGLEDLWTYTSQIMGRAGVAFINNSTGNLTLMREDLSIAGGKMPVGITSFYNYDAKATGARFSWKTNYEQTITQLTIGLTNYYKYIDGDGTAIYFYSSSEQWIDELGKGLVLTIDTNSTTARYVIKDKRDNKLEFNDSGLLVKLKDNSETPNSVSITHVSGRIDTVSDSSGRVFDYGYDTANRLTQIEYKGSDNVTKRTVTYAYVDTSSTKTLTVTYPDLKSVTYTYDSEYKIIKSEDIDHSTVEFSYFGSPKIMESVTEHATDGTTLGNRFIFDYTQYETKITDKYDQDVFYQFDNYGRTIGIKDINNAAQYYEYGASGGSQNKLTSVSKLQTTTVNLAKNISFESTSDWAQTDTSGLLTTPIYSTTEKLFGTKSLSITHNGAVGRVIKAYENIPISLTQETSFTVSAYVKSTAAGVAHVGLVGGSATCVEFAVDEANVWQRIFATITVPQTVTSLQIQLVVDGAATVYFDGVQLEEGLGVNRYNLVENPSLEHVSGTLPNGWTATNMTGSDGSTSATSAFNSKSYLVNGNALSDKSLSQTITLSGNAGDVFSFGGWAKANAAPKKSDRSFQVTLTFNNTDSTTTVVSVPFNNPSTAWQYAEGKAVATKAYSSVKISFDYKKQLNTVTFDGAQVYREAFGQTFSYDANGNLLSAKDLEGNTDLTTYDQSNQLLRQVNADGTYVAYDYDNFQRVTAAQSSTGVATKITYDQFGNPLTTSISSDVFMKKLIAYYDFDGNAEDKSGNNHDATYNNGTYVSGKVGSALRFNGSNQYAELGLFKVPDTFSVSMWVKNERIVANESLIGKHTDAGADQLVLGQYSSKLTAIIGGTSVDFDTKTLGYQFLVAIYTKVNATTTHLTVYNNAVKVYDADLAGVIGDTSTGKPWTLGMEWDSSTTKSDFFQGSIDELAFYEGALDEQEIETLYKQANTKQLIAKYDFTNASGTSVPDVTNNGHHATVVGGATFANGQLVLNGSTGYMQLDDFTIGNSLSVAMTVKADVVKNAALFAKHTATGSNILVSGYYGGWEMNIRGNIKNQGTMLANTNYTVVYTIDPINTTQSVIQAYVNGSPIYPANYTINVLLGDTSGKAWVIGQEWDSSTASDFFDGTIDNIQIYNYALSADEVSANAAALTNGSYDPATPVNPITWDKRITSSATYTTDGNYITSVTDSRGNTANYSYDTTFGRLDTFRAPGEAESEATTYSYESNTDRLKKVEKIVDGKTYTNSYTYDLDQLTKISHNGFDYEFTYDIFGNPHQIKVAGNVLITNDYEDNNGLLSSIAYGNGNDVSFAYDDYHRVISKTIDDVLKYEYAYDHQGNLARTVEHNGTSTVTTTYVYDFLNRLTKMVSSNGNTLNYHFDTYGRVDVLTNRLGTSTYTHSYVYGDATKESETPGLIYTVKLNGSTRLSYDFDPLARLSSRTIATTTPFTTTYTYLDGAGSHSTPTLMASLTNGSNPAYSYTYDANGNILTISEGATLKASYTYDTMNQLIREDSAYSSKSIDYVYDIGGNLTSKTIYTFTCGVRGAQEDSIVYLYENDWKDQLSSYDGQSITYDAIGNPLSYRNGLSFTWANGRELAGVTNNGVTGTFTYNDSGIRTSKTYNGVTTSYLLNGSSIVRQTQGESTLDFFYDENGNLYGFQKGTSTYYYLRNGQNDIVGILDSNGIQVVSYTYDAWGNQLTVSGTLATTIGEENPFRYRGYYFDTETGLYYLNSRYYDSVTGRFINADGLISTSSTLLGTNMYAYCENNPVMLTDKEGTIALVDDAIIVFAALAIVGIIEIQQTLSSPEAKRGISTLASAASNAIDRAYGKFEETCETALTIYATASSIAIAKSMARTVEKIKVDSQKYDYWIAFKISYGKMSTYIPTLPLTYKEAIVYVRLGGDVFASSRTNAKRLATAAGFGAPAAGPEISNLPENGFWRHYHTGDRLGGHVFYVSGY